MSHFSRADRVRIENPESCQNGRIGLVVEANQDTKIALVDLDGQFVEVAFENLKDATFDWSVQ